MQFDLPTIILIFITSFLCITGLIGGVLLFTFGVKKRMEETDRIISDLEKFAKDNTRPLPVATRLLAGIYLLISLSILGALLFLVVVISAYYAGFPLTNNINVESLGFISAVILLGAIIMTPVLAIVSKKIFKSR